MNINEQFKDMMRRPMNKENITKILNYFCDEWWSPAGSEFDYSFIEINEINKKIKLAKEQGFTLDIYISQSNYGNNNPIFCHIYDGCHLIIYDWYNFKHHLVIGEIDLTDDEKEYLIEHFGTPTLEEYLAQEYSPLHQEVRYALEQEVNEFYNIYKNDIIMKDDHAYSVSDGMYLDDAIWNYAPLFCNGTIARLVTKLYKGELKL